MSAHDNGGAAFPTGTGVTPYNPGMTLRDYFAAKASEEDILAQGELLRDKKRQETNIGLLPNGWRTIARYMHADAMLAARKEGQQ